MNAIGPPLATYPSLKALTVPQPERTTGWETLVTDQNDSDESTRTLESNPNFRVSVKSAFVEAAVKILKLRSLQIARD